MAQETASSVAPGVSGNVSKWQFIKMEKSVGPLFGPIRATILVISKFFYSPKKFFNSE
jgi:hypothetical protein